MNRIFNKAALSAFAMSLLLAGGCQSGEQPLKLTVKMPGIPNGAIVKLMDVDRHPGSVIDSFVVDKEEFVLEAPAAWSHAKSCALSVEINNDDNLRKNARFFAENGEMTYECPFESVPSYYWNPNPPKTKPVITGSETENLYQEYKLYKRPFSLKVSEMNDKYYNLVSSDDADSKKAEIFDIIHQTQARTAEAGQADLKFIKEHPASLVSLQVANFLLSRNFALFTADQVNEVVNALDPSLKTSDMYADFEETVEGALALAKGAHFMDGNLLDMDGNAVRLKDYIQPGKYNMLEFWASWCGPCRGEIPHLKRIYNLSKDDNFNIISMSLDDNVEKWHKAIKEEDLKWTQLRCGDKVWDAEMPAKYKVGGVPTSFVLDPDGNIVCGSLRGLELDCFLHDNLGMKF